MSKLVPFATLLSALPNLSGFHLEVVVDLLIRDFSARDRNDILEDFLKKGRFEEEPTLTFIPRHELHKLLQPGKDNTLFVIDRLEGLKKGIEFDKLSSIPRIRNNQIFKHIYSNRDPSAYTKWWILRDLSIRSLTEEEQLDLLEDNFDGDNEWFSILLEMTMLCRVMSALKILCRIHRPRAYIASIELYRSLDPHSVVTFLIPQFIYKMKGLDRLKELLNYGQTGIPLFQNEQRRRGLEEIAKLKAAVTSRKPRLYFS